MDRRSALKTIGALLAAGTAAPYIPIKSLMKLKAPRVVPFPTAGALVAEFGADIMEFIARDLALAVAQGVDDAVINGEAVAGRKYGVFSEYAPGLITKANTIDVERELRRQSIGRVENVTFGHDPLTGYGRVYAKVKLL